jgi:hypothetical protein
MPTSRLIACPAEHVGIRFYDAPRLRAKGRGGALRGRRCGGASARVAGLEIDLNAEISIVIRTQQCIQ